MAPLISVTYQSPRHIFLASAGPLVALSGAATVSRRARPRAAFAALFICLIALVQFTEYTRDALPAWHASSRYSRALVELLRDRNDSPDTVVIVQSAPPVRVWFWQWALPFATQEPFVNVRARIVGVPDWSCCPGMDKEREALLRDVSTGAVRQVRYVGFNAAAGRFEDEVITR